MLDTVIINKGMQSAFSLRSQDRMRAAVMPTSHATSTTHVQADVNSLFLVVATAMLTISSKYISRPTLKKLSG